MSEPKEDTAHDVIEQDFKDALQRLVEGIPKHKKLRESLKTGKLKINVANVALEAGRSRTLIGTKRSKYPAIREAISLAQGGKKSVPSTYTELIKNNRFDLAKAKAENKMLQDLITEHFTARKIAEKNASREAARAANLSKELRKMQKVVGLISKEEAAPLPRLILVRGLPGSGKTTRAIGYKEQGYEHFEADKYFKKENGNWEFDEAKLPDAHASCLKKTSLALARGAHVVVANVFCTVQDIWPYVDLGFSFQIVEADGHWKSIHDVPESTIRAMKAMWMPTDMVLAQLKSKGKVETNVTHIASRKDSK